jgi:hypothetical protein
MSEGERVGGEPPVGKATLWFGLLGGGVAWLAHLLLSYLIAEFGCMSGWGKETWLGVTTLAWLLLAVSFLTLLGAGLAVYVAFRSKQRLGRSDPSEEPASAEYMARAGYITSGVFLFIILVESVPIFFFLQSC